MAATALPRLRVLISPSSSSARIPPVPLITATTHLPSSGRKPQRLAARAKGFGIAVPEKGRQEEDGGGGGGGNRGRRDDDDDDDEEIPQVVFDRMVRRILIAVGLPMASGVALLYILDSLKEKGIWDVPLWLPFASTLLSFGTSALGIAYGTLSTSWDPERQGSLLGWEEAARNWPKLWEEENGEQS